MTTASPETAITKRLHTMPFGPHWLEDGSVEFRLWTPTAERVDLVLQDANDSPKLDSVMSPTGNDGWVTLTTGLAQAGDRYRFRIDGNLLVPDPASRYQPCDVHGPSQLMDARTFEWQDTGWQGRPWAETILYELHIGTFTPQGTYLAAIEKLDYLKNMGVTAIELMPVSDFPGRFGWGYDGVLHYAPEANYGTPNELKLLVQEAHKRGLMVFMDVVYNHFGPDGNYLYCYANTMFQSPHQTPWGNAIDYNLPWVREFVIHNALYWVDEFHMDGLRFDAVHAIFDMPEHHILNELARRVHDLAREQGRHIHLVLENDANQACFLQTSTLQGAGTQNKISHSQHSKAPSAGQNADQNTDKNAEKYVAQWNDDSHHAYHVLASGETDGYYADYAAQTSANTPMEHLARCLTQGFTYQGQPSPFRDGETRGEPTASLPLTAFVNFIQNHDQIGNRAFGERLTTLTSPEKLQVLQAALLLSPSIPMLYMGEEYGETAPFLFFSDLAPELATSVTEGRRAEFAKFAKFSNPELVASIPDPCAVSTFERSRLDWQKLQKPGHQQALQHVQELLRLRQRQLVPFLNEFCTGAHQVHMLGDEAMLVSWQGNSGRQWQMALNLSSIRIPLDRDKIADDFNIVDLPANTWKYSWPGNSATEVEQNGHLPPTSIIVTS